MNQEAFGLIFTGEANPYMRHTYGTMMAELNTPTHLLCNQMGHGKIQVTQQYYLAVSKYGVQILQRNLNRL